MEPEAFVVWVVVFVVVTVAVTGLSSRAGWSAPVALVTVGGVASFIPGVPAVVLEPEPVLWGLLPPLLFAASLRTSIVDVRARRDSILVLSVGLVIVTVVVAGFASFWIIPGITLAAGFAFAAVIAPTDAVAVTAVTGGVALPRRVVTVLEGESLLNDATALVALNAAILAIVALVDPWQIAGEFVLAVAVGVGTGLAVGFVMGGIRRVVRSPVLDTSLALITPYLAFIVSEALLGSGVLAVVIAGLYLGYRSPVVQSADARIAERVNWRTVAFLLENAVFLFIGLNLAGIVTGAISHAPGLWPTIAICAAILVVIVATRFAFVMLVTFIYRVGPRRLRERSWSWRNGIVVSAAGARGVVTLAAVFLLPPETPAREFLQFLAFVVVIATLLGAAGLPRLVRLLKLPPPSVEQERAEWRTLMAEAQSAGLERLEQERTDVDEDRVLARLRANATLISDSIEHPVGDDSEPTLKAYTRLRRRMIEAERDAVLAARSEGRYSDLAVRAVLRAIDAEEITLRAGDPKKDRG